MEDDAFRQRWRHNNHVTSLTEYSSNTNLKRTVIGGFLNFFGVSMGGKHLMRF